MAVPTFRGVALGQALSLTTAPAPRASANRQYFGETLTPIDAGGRGGTTVLLSALSGAGSLGLAQAEFAIRSLNDGVPGVLIDTLGVSWPNVLLDSIEPLGRVRQSPDGVMFRTYRIYLRHLI
jgi:hypothetical protein